MKNIVLTVQKAEGFIAKTKGLLGQEKIDPLLLKTRFGIHTFGMRQPIDVVILDSKNIVVGVKENLFPNKLFLWNPKFSKILELPSNTIKEKHITLGKKVFLTYK